MNPWPTLTDDQITALGLTTREVEVLYCIAAGMGTHETADRLFLSVNSIKTHTQKLFAKIGVRSRLQAAVWLWRRSGHPLD